MSRYDILDIINGYYLAQLLIHLNKQGAFKKPTTKKSIKKYFGNEHLFTFFHCQTDLFEKDGNFFWINPQYHSYMNSGFHIDKFLGAYGTFNHNKKHPGIETDETEFSKAFEIADTFHDPVEVLKILSALKAKTVLDLGCGMSKVIRKFCEAAPFHKAIGIDQNIKLYKLSSASIRENGLVGRIKIIHGNVANFENLLTQSQIDSIDVVYASSLLNEFFSSEQQIVRFLKKIKRYFPDKYFVVTDYYGALEGMTKFYSGKKLNYVHDVMQILSGQGLPPKNHSEWNKYYLKACCKLLYVYEGTDKGIRWFIHILKS